MMNVKLFYCGKINDEKKIKKVNDEKTNLLLFYKGLFCTSRPIINQLVN